jgi:hypothetical protein
MILAQILTAWTGSGSEDDPHRPQLADDHPLISCCDVTVTVAAHIVPSPNALVVQCQVDDYVMTQIEADANYGPAAVVWSEPQP